MIDAQTKFLSSTSDITFLPPFSVVTVEDPLLSMKGIVRESLGASRASNVLLRWSSDNGSLFSIGLLLECFAAGGEILSVAECRGLKAVLAIFMELRSMVIISSEVIWQTCPFSPRIVYEQAGLTGMVSRFGYIRASENAQLICF
jgi:hypothetical protein